MRVSSIILSLLVLGALTMGALPHTTGQGHAQSSTATWRVVLKEAAKVDGDVVTLGHIATPMGLVDQEQWQALAATPLFQAPPEKGKPMFVQPDAIRSALNQHLGEASSMVIINKRLVLQRGGVLLDKERLRDQVVRSLTAHCANLGGELEFREIKGPNFLFLADESHQLQIVPSKGVCKPGRQGYRIQERTIDGRLARSMAGSVFLDAWQDVLVAARPLSKGEPITEDMLTRARKNASYVKGTPWDGHGGPWRMARSVGQGQALSASDVESLPAIVKGSFIEMVYEGKHVILRVPAKAMGDGAIGDRILVKNTHSNRDVYATVRDARTVTVQ